MGKEEEPSCAQPSNRHESTEELDYKEAIKIINSMQANASLIQGYKTNHKPTECKNTLETRKFLQRCGVSLERLDTLSVIHVAGTKGKGSTSAFCESILRHHGYKTGFFSSPHLISVRERVRVHGRLLPKTRFTSYVRHVYAQLRAQRDAEHDMPPYFKFLTTLAFHVFLEEGVDVAIVEVGVGGEYDCTNVLRQVVAVGITSLGVDHTSLLGDTIQEIAWHKAGIMKPGSVAYTTGNQAPEAMAVLRARSAERQCPLLTCPQIDGYDWGPHARQLGIAAEVQKENASLALQLAHHWIQNHAKNRNGVLVNPSDAARCHQSTVENKSVLSSETSAKSERTLGLSHERSILNIEISNSNGITKNSAAESNLNTETLVPQASTRDNGVVRMNPPEDITHNCHHASTHNSKNVTSNEAASSFPITLAMARGLKYCQWPGRTQFIPQGHVHYYLDGAHTLESMKACTEWFQQVKHSSERENVARVLIFNVTGDRNASQFLILLFALRFHHVIFCLTNTTTKQDLSLGLESKNLTVEQQKLRCHEYESIWRKLEDQTNSLGDSNMSDIRSNSIQTVPGVTEAVTYLSTQGGQLDVLVTGSLHLIGAVLSIIDPELTSMTHQIKKELCGSQTN